MGTLMRSAGIVLLAWSSASCGSGDTLSPSVAGSAGNGGHGGVSGVAGAAGQGAAGAEQDAAAPDLLAGLVAWYPFKGDARDASGNGRDAVVHGATLTSDRNGTEGAAYHFDGTTYMEAPGTELPESNTERTISAWVSPETVGTDPYKGNAFLSWGTGDCVGKMFGLGNYFSRLIVWTGCADVHSALTMQPATWAFVAVRYRQPHDVTVWVDDRAQDAINDYIGTTSGRLFIGVESIDDGATFRHWYEGSISDLRVYDRALSDEEIALLRQQ